MKMFVSITLIIFGIFCTIFGIYLIPATMWREICIGLLVIGVISIIVGVLTFMKKKDKDKQ